MVNHYQMKKYLKILCRIMQTKNVNVSKRKKTGKALDLLACVCANREGLCLIFHQLFLKQYFLYVELFLANVILWAGKYV